MQYSTKSTFQNEIQTPSKTLLDKKKQLDYFDFPRMNIHADRG